MSAKTFLKDWQKQRITELQLAGYKNEDIGLAVGIPAESARSFCKRHHIEKGNSDHPLPPLPIYCAACGKVVQQNPHRKLKRYCCTQCRWDYANSLRDSSRQQPKTAVCQFCGKTFQYTGTRVRKYCSQECMIKARSAKTTA